MTRKKITTSTALALTCLAILPAPVTAQSPSSTPQYTAVRWNEDYSYLRDPSKRTDFFDPIKYIPLNDAGDWYLSLGGQARYRYEFFNHANFGSGSQDPNGYELLRLLGHADLHLGQNFRFFVEGKSSTIEDGGIGPGGSGRPSDVDTLDLQQGFVDFIIPFSGGSKNSLTTRFGRQEFTYGVQRVMGPSDWANVRRSFDGIKFSLKTGSNTLDAFWVRPVDIEKYQFNNGDPNTSFAGLYDTYALPGLIAPNDKSAVELYALALNRTNARFAGNASSASAPIDENRYTLGARFSTKPAPWDFDAEGAYQFGQYGGGNIAAWMFATEGGYTFAQCPWTPRLFLGFDIASGDDDPKDSDLQTYNQLFPTAHAFFGLIDVIGRQNIIDLHPGLEVTPLENTRYAKKLSARAEYHLFWRQNTADALYNTASGAASAPASAGVERGAGGSDASFVGSEIDFLLTWQIDRHLNAYIGYSHFFAGDFIQQTNTGRIGDDIDFFYAAVTYTF